MELTVSLLLDLVILGLLLYCLIQGLRRGFILTLCSLSVSYTHLTLPTILLV